MNGQPLTDDDGILSVNILVRYKTPVAQGVAIVNTVGGSSATITPTNDYPLTIRKTDRENLGKVINDAAARFLVKNAAGDIVAGGENMRPVFIQDGYLRTTRDDGTIVNVTVPTPGTYTVTEIKAPTGYTLDSVPLTVEVSTSGGSAEYDFFNSPSTSSTLEWGKVDPDGNRLAGSQWVITGKDIPEGTIVVDCVTDGCSAGQYSDVDPRPGYFQLTGLPFGTNYSIKEHQAPEGYQVLDSESFPITETSASTPVGRLQGQSSTILNAEENAVINRPIGTLRWTKVDADDRSQALSGSVWTLSGPGISGSVEITDCTVEGCAGTGVRDTDPAPGSFLIEGLTHTKQTDVYTVVEKAAPAGYRLDTTPRTLTVNTDPLQITNSQQTVPPLPLTGGTASDWFLIIGGGAGLAAIGTELRRRRNR